MITKPTLSVPRMQFHLTKSHPTSLESLLNKTHIIMIQWLILGLEVDDLANTTLNDQFGAPKARNLSWVKNSSRSLCYSCSQDTVILCMYASATQHFCPHFFTVVAHFTSSIVAVDGPSWSAIVAWTNDAHIADYDCPHCLF